MPTLRQKKVAEKLVEALESDTPPTAGELLENVGYSHSVATAKPGEILESKGVQDALQELGFTTLAADAVVNEILHSGFKEESRLKAADMVYKRLGAYAPDKSMSLNVNIDTKQNPEAEKLAQEYEEKLKQNLLDA